MARYLFYGHPCRFKYMLGERSDVDCAPDGPRPLPDLQPQEAARPAPHPGFIALEARVGMPSMVLSRLCLVHLLPEVRLSERYCLPGAGQVYFQSLASPHFPSDGHL